jgi:hypothetical protein
MPTTSLVEDVMVTSKLAAFDRVWLNRNRAISATRLLRLRLPTSHKKREGPKPVVALLQETLANLAQSEAIQ